MLNVKLPKEVYKIIEENFSELKNTEEVALLDAQGLILAENIVSSEYIPSFSRSTVDGYAVLASDTFGCSESIPAVLPVSLEIKMGKEPKTPLNQGNCMKIPTGGYLPDGADSVVMLEYTEDYGDGTVGIFKPASPGLNLIYKGDDKKPGDVLIHKGTKLSPKEIGSLAALGITKVKVKKPLTVAIISTGDEIVPIEASPKEGEIRNVNSALLISMMKEIGADVIDFGILKDEEKLLSKTLDEALKKSDMVLISGGSSAGEKDCTSKVIESKGTLLLHGIAIKPGKPTILGISNGKPVFGLPGHPVASYFVTEMFVKYAASILLGCTNKKIFATAKLTESIESNHGRAQFGGVTLKKKNGILFATPIRSKSGLITTLSETDGYYYIDENCEGKKSGEEIEVYMYGI